MPVHEVTNWTFANGRDRARNGADQGGRAPTRRAAKALRMAETFRARIRGHHGQASFVFEITGAPAKIDSFIDLMRPLGLVRCLAHRCRRHQPRTPRLTFVM